MTTHAHPWDASYPKDLAWNHDVATYPLHHVLERTAEKYGDRPAFDFLGRKYSWSEINDYSSKLAKGFQDLGIEKGAHVGLLLPNCPYFIFSYYALLRIGATVVHFNPLYPARELKDLIEVSKTTHMITVDLKLTFDKVLPFLDDPDNEMKHIIVGKFCDCLPPLKKYLFKAFKGSECSAIPSGNAKVSHIDSLFENDGNYKAVEISPKDDIALLQFTGGTTGVPKAAMLTHANLSANTEQCALWFHRAKEGEERIAGVLPFFHVFAMTAIMNLGTRLGMEIYTLPRFDLKQTLKMIEKNKITFFPAVPAIYTAINNYKKLDSYDLSSIKTCVSGGAPLPMEVKKAFEKNTDCVLVEGYGLTESSPVACVNPVIGENKAGSIGMPLPQTQIKLFNLDDPNSPVEQGERGELCIKGPQVMKGYFDRPDETAKTFTPDGFLRTGDVAIMDEEGYFFIVDRIKDMIISNGYNIYPRHVEEAIYLHPAIEECIVAGVPDAKRGEAVKAWIKLKNGKSLQALDLKSFLQDKLSPLELPRHIEFRDQPLPKTMIGKLSRKDILEEENGGAATS